MPNWNRWMAASAIATLAFALMSWGVPMCMAFTLFCSYDIRAYIEREYNPKEQADAKD